MSDIEVAAIVEGQAEQMFVERLLSPHLALRGVRIWATLPGRMQRRGGVRAWESIRGDIERALRERDGRYVTTMFDFYAMPDDWPGRRDAASLSMQHKGECVEKAMREHITGRFSDRFNPNYLIPYVQMHEFEAILFTEIDILNDVLKTLPGGYDRGNELRKIRAHFPEPEAINDSPETAPSKRIARLAWSYKKTTHGLIVAQRTGLGAIRNACPHFNDWVTKLESLGCIAQ